MFDQELKLAYTMAADPLVRQRLRAGSLYAGGPAFEPRQRRTARSSATLHLESMGTMITSIVLLPI